MTSNPELNEVSRMPVTAQDGLLMATALAEFVHTASLSGLKNLKAFDIECADGAIKSSRRAYELCIGFYENLLDAYQEDENWDDETKAYYEDALRDVMYMANESEMRLKIAEMAFEIAVKTAPRQENEDERDTL